MFRGFIIHLIALQVLLIGGVFPLKAAPEMVVSSQPPVAIATVPNRPSEETAVVDILEVLNQSLAMQEWQATFSKHVHDDQSYLASIEQNLRGRELVMAKQMRGITQGTLSQEEKDKQTSALIDQRHQYDYEISALQDFLLRRKEYLDGIFSEGKNRVQGAVSAIVTEMALKSGFQLVVNRSQIVYVHPQRELTAQVIFKLNQKMPTLNLSVEPIVTFKQRLEKEQKGTPHGK